MTSRPLARFLQTAVVFFVLLVAFLNQVQPVSAVGNQYTVSLAGNDNNSGTAASPFKTFAKAFSVIQAGDTLNIQPGTYTERVVVNKSGTSAAPITINGNGAIIDGQNNQQNLLQVPASTQYVNISHLEVKNSSNFGVLATGQHLVLDQITSHHNHGMGLQVDGQHIVIKNSTVYMSTLENQPRAQGSGWGSGFKCRVGGDDITFQNNTAYNNYGEGFAITRCTNVKVTGNTSYNNFAVNIYIDNSHDVVIEKNLVWCTANSGFEKLDGTRPSGILMGEEQYDGWGAQLARVTIKNNLVNSCSRGVMYFGSDVAGGGLDTVTIANNTLWGSTNTALSLASEPTKTRNTVVMNNIVQQPQAKLAWIENPTGITLKNNFWVGGAPNASSNANGPGDKSGDVKLVSIPSITAASFALSAQSSAINGGAVTAAVTDDYFGASRGSSPDMGGIEYLGVQVSPIPTPSPSPSVSPSPSLSPTPSPTNVCRTKREDVNNDGVVNLLDYSAVVYGLTQDTVDPKIDVIQDNKINLLDIADVIANLMKVCP